MIYHLKVFLTACLLATPDAAQTCKPIVEADYPTAEACHADAMRIVYDDGPATHHETGKKAICSKVE